MLIHIIYNNLVPFFVFSFNILIKINIYKDKGNINVNFKVGYRLRVGYIRTFRTNT